MYKPQKVCFRSSRPLDFIYDSSNLLTPAERKRQEQKRCCIHIRGFVRYNQKAVLNNRIVKVKVMNSVGKDETRSSNSNQSFASSTIMMDSKCRKINSESTVVRAQYLADVAGINRYKYFYRPIELVNAEKDKSVKVKSNKVNIDRATQHRAKKRNTEFNTISSNSLMSVPELPHIMDIPSGCSSHKMHKKRAARLYLRQRDIAERLHSTGAHSSENSICHRCWIHSSPKKKPLKPNVTLPSLDPITSIMSTSSKSKRKQRPKLISMERNVNNNQKLNGLLNNRKILVKEHQNDDQELAEISLAQLQKEIELFKIDKIEENIDTAGLEEEWGMISSINLSTVLNEPTNTTDSREKYDQQIQTLKSETEIKTTGTQTVLCFDTNSKDITDLETKCRIDPNELLNSDLIESAVWCTKNKTNEQTFDKTAWDDAKHYIAFTLFPESSRLVVQEMASDSPVFWKE